jgi:hypothetical protein
VLQDSEFFFSPFFPLFPTCSLLVPNGFPIRFSICSPGSQCVPQGCSQQHLALIQYVLPKVLPFSPIEVDQRGEALPLVRCIVLHKTMSGCGKTFSNFFLGTPP